MSGASNEPRRRRWVPWRLVLLAGMMAGSWGCEEIKGPDPNYEYLMTRVDELEEKVQLLELRVEQLGGEGDFKEADSSETEKGPNTAGVASVNSGESVLMMTLGGTDFESQLEEVENQRNSLGLRLRQLETTRRSELPELLEALGVSAPSILSLETERRELMGRLATMPTGGDAALELGDEIHRIDLRIEFEADAVRNDLIEQEKVEAAKVDVLLKGMGVESGAVLSGETEMPAVEIQSEGGDSLPQFGE